MPEAIIVGVGPHTTCGRYTVLGLVKEDKVTGGVVGRGTTLFTRMVPDRTDHTILTITPPVGVVPRGRDTLVMRDPFPANWYMPSTPTGSPTKSVDDP